MQKEISAPTFAQNIHSSAGISLSGWESAKLHVPVLKGFGLTQAFYSQRATVENGSLKRRHSPLRLRTELPRTAQPLAGEGRVGVPGPSGETPGEFALEMILGHLQALSGGWHPLFRTLPQGGKGPLPSPIQAVSPQETELVRELFSHFLLLCGHRMFHVE